MKDSTYTMATKSACTFWMVTGPRKMQGTRCPKRFIRRFGNKGPVSVSPRPRSCMLITGLATFSGAMGASRRS